jgi:hypothetical protein
VVPHTWLPKTTSGKIARRASRQRYLDELARTRPAGAPPQTEPLAECSPIAFVAWSLGVALTIYLALALAENPSWGVYAGF